MESAAQLISQARIRHARLPELPQAQRPTTEQDAYRCQDFVIRQLLDHYGGQVAGYKIACTNALAQQQLHVDGPFYGRLMSSFCFDSPARLEAGQFFMRVVEAEFGFRMARNLPPLGRPRTREEVADAVEGVVPAIEIVDSRFENWTERGAPSLIADNACHAVWVQGQILRDWRTIDLAAQKVDLTANGKVVREGSGAAVLGHPLNALHWLAERLNADGLGLEKGQSVTTGVTTDVYLAQQGERFVAGFGPVGTAEVEFV